MRRTSSSSSTTFSFLLLLLLALLGNHIVAQTTTSKTQQNSCLTITQIACEAEGFDILCAAIQTTNLAVDLNGEYWTIFAPKNTAFEQLPERLIEEHMVNVVALTDLLLFHIVGGVALESSELLCNQDLEMANGDITTTLCGDNNTTTTTADNTTTTTTNSTTRRLLYQVGSGNVNHKPYPQIIAENIKACNGIVHVIDQVLLFGNNWNNESDSKSTTTTTTSNTTTNTTDGRPSNDTTTVDTYNNKTKAPATIPTISSASSSTSWECNGTLTDVICGTQNFSTFCAALVAADLDVILNMDDDVYTVFVPNNEAFAKLGDAALSFLLEPSQFELLSNLLWFHTVPEQALLLRDLNCAMGSGANLLNMGNGEDSRTVCRTPFVYQKGDGNLDEAKPEIIDEDITSACNGIIHVLNEVMLYKDIETLGIPPSDATIAPTDKIVTSPTTAPVATSNKPTDAPPLFTNSDEPADIPSTIDDTSDIPSNSKSMAPSEPTVPTKTMRPAQPSPTRVPTSSCKTIGDILCDDPQFEALCQRLRKTGLLGALSMGEWTIFAPVNDAFVGVPRSYLDYLNNDISELYNFLLFHVVANNVIEKDDLPCTAGQNLVRMATSKDTRTFCVNEVPTFQKGGGNPDDDKPLILEFDRLACNGVIHTLDKVLLYKPIPELFQ